MLKYYHYGLVAALACIAQPGLSQNYADVKGYVEVLGGVAQHRAELNKNERILSDTAFTQGVRVGIAFNDYVAFEGSYQDFGEVNEREEVQGGDTYDTEIDVRAFRLGTRLSVPLNQWLNLTGRLGFSYWDYDVDLTNETTTDTFRVVDSGNDPYYGVGMRFELGSMFHIGVEYNRSKMQTNLNGLNVAHELGDATVSFGYNF